MKNSLLLKEKRLFLFDIDGTVCRGEAFLPGAREFLDAICARGGKYVFITNNSTKGTADYIRKFERLGLRIDETNLETALSVTKYFLKEHYADKEIFCMGTESLYRELEESGLHLTKNPDAEVIDAVLVGYDSELTYQKLVDVCRVLSTREVDYLATNPDLVCPSDFGFIPDCGSICGMIENAVGRQPHYLGKPDPVIVNHAIAGSGFTPAQTVVVGDRLYTDILSGMNAGVDTALVLTGEAKLEDLADGRYTPDWVFESVKEMDEAWRLRDDSLSGI